MFYTIEENNILDIISYVQGIFTDTLPFVLLVCGVITGMYILGGFINNKDEK